MRWPPSTGRLGARAGDRRRWGRGLSAENRTALKQAGLLVYLRATPETLAGRLTGVNDRPLLKDATDRAGRIRDLLVARGPIYESPPGTWPSTTDRNNVEQVAVEVMDWYRRRVGAMAGR